MSFLFGGVWAPGASPLEPPSYPSLTPSPHARIPISLPNVRPSSSREMYVEKSRERGLGKALNLWRLQQGGRRGRNQGERQGWARPPAATRQILSSFPPQPPGQPRGAARRSERKRSLEEVRGCCGRVREDISPYAKQREHTRPARGDPELNVDRTRDEAGHEERGQPG